MQELGSRGACEANGHGLGSMWGEETATRMLHEAGFKNVAVKRIDGDFLNNYYLSRLD